MAAAKKARPGEFALIARYFRPLATHPGAFRLMDDAALLTPPRGEEIVLKTDLIAEGVHFFADDPPASIAKKALRVNLSDLAAKGARPLGYLLSLALSSDWTEAWVKAFAAGLKEDQKRYRLPLLGGDTSRSAGGLTISIAAVGCVPSGGMVLRSGARPGDLLYVSGTIGDAALGLRLRQGTLEPKTAGRNGVAYLLGRYLHPEPRLGLGPTLRRRATSAMDVSDGLVGDFAHICTASGVSGEIDSEAVPLSPAARRLVSAGRSAFETALTGGDDYEILATVRPRAAAALEREAAAAGIAVTRIGRITKGRGAPKILRAGAPIRFAKTSFDHFGSD